MITTIDLFLLSSLFTFPITFLAQSLSGTIVNQAVHSLNYVSVLFKDAVDTTIVKSVMTDKQGHFSLKSPKCIQALCAFPI